MLDQSTVTMSLKAQTNAVSIAVVVPCHNEELTIANVVSDFQRHLPEVPSPLRQAVRPGMLE